MGFRVDSRERYRVNGNTREGYQYVTVIVWGGRKEAGDDHLLEGEWEESDLVDVSLQSQVGRVPHVHTRVP
jgi:hypothetical protein